jgi:hypothetical protein
MLATIKKFIKDLLTENDGFSYCPIRVFAFALSVPAVILFTVGCALQIYHGHFSVQDMATAFATLSGGFAAFGGSVTLKALTDNRR